MKTALIAIAGSSILFPSAARAVLGVGDIVSDPVVEYNTTQKNIFDNIKYAWEQTQWADKLATLHDTLFTVRENLQTLVLVKAAIGDPSAIPALMDQLMLDGALSESGIFQTMNDIGGIIREGGLIAMQLEYLNTPINLDGWKNAARSGNFYSYTYNSDPLARYQATQFAFQRYNGSLQASVYRARYMRTQLQTLNARLGTATTDAEVQKVKGSIVIADAALQDIETGIEQSASQIQVAHTMAENRAGEEREAYRASLDELNHEVEANLQLPIEDVSTATPNFDLPVEEIAPVTTQF
jgi:hypothetical protein